MPMPVSATASSTHSRPSATLRTRKATSPSFVNLQALLKRLSRICLSRMESAVSEPTFSCASTTRRFLFFSPVRAPQHIEGVADQWHRAEHTVERYVAEHARDHVARRAKLVGLVHDEQRQRRGDDVADDGKEPDQRIQAEAHAGARDDERGVKQGCKRVDPCNAGAPRAGAREVVEAEAIGGGHGD